MAKEFECPNCGLGHKLVPKENGQGVCATCGGTFTPGPEPKLVNIGEFDQLKGKVEKLEKENTELRELLKPRPQPGQEPTPEPDALNAQGDDQAESDDDV